MKQPEGLNLVIECASPPSRGARIETSAKTGEGVREAVAPFTGGAE